MDIKRLLAGTQDHLTAVLAMSEISGNYCQYVLQCWWVDNEMQKCAHYKNAHRLGFTRQLPVPLLPPSKSYARLSQWQNLIPSRTLEESLGNTASRCLGSVTQK